MSTNTTAEVGSVDAQENMDNKVISSKTATSIVDDSVDELSRKANMLNLSETQKQNHQTTNLPKFKNNYYQNRKPYNSNNCNFSANRSYHLPYSAYPYPIINSAALLPNSSIQMIPSPYMYASGYANVSNSMYSPRHNSHYKTNKERRASVTTKYLYIYICIKLDSSLIFFLFLHLEFA